MTDEARVGLSDYGRALWRFRAGIVVVTLFATVVAFGYGRMQPKVYVSRATILLKQDSQSGLMSSFGQFLGGGGERGGGGGGISLPSVSLAMPSSTSNQDVFLALLKSRTLREAVIANLEPAYPGVSDRILSVDTDTRQRGVIGVTVEAREAKLAADAANHYFAELNKQFAKTADEQARQQESLLTVQLERSANTVGQAEAQLLRFQSENRVLAMDATPNKSAVEAVALLRSQIMGLEMQREVMRMRYTEAHPQMREIEKQIAEMKKQYSRDLYGAAMDLPPEGPNSRTPRKEFFVAADRMTPMQFQFLKLYRNLKIQEALYTAALQGLQQIRQRDGLSDLSVQILDPALPPGGAARPSLPLMVVAGLAGGLVISAALALVVDFAARSRGRSDRRRLRPNAAPRHGGNGAELFPGKEERESPRPVAP